jgi:hypothetical protein
MGKKNKSSIVSGAGWIGAFSSLLIEGLDELGVSSDDIHKLGKPTSEGRPLVRACAKKIFEVLKYGAPVEFLKYKERIIFDACDGSALLADAGDVFPASNLDFSNWAVDERGEDTGGTPVDTYDIVKGGTLAQLFGSLSSDVGKLCLTQAQIISFFQQGNYGNFFLFKSYNQFFVASIHNDPDSQLTLWLRRFGWDVEVSSGVVVVPAA